ncbi:DMT family transporter [Marinibacterium sp. SX1]|uniref:DMT family transporter n=1 Tax=Marinibacterium sp. SX1 TaxID=3388424 RepID=UPI003D17E5FA
MLAGSAVTGAGLVVIYTGLISSADAITKLIAGGYAAPQLYALSGLIVVALSLAADRHPGRRQGLGTGRPGAMALRAGATVVAALAFFQAFRLLPFAEVFLFIGLMPLMAGLMSGPILGEHVRPTAWGALAAGFIGVLCLFPEGRTGLGPGHLWALLASLAGTLSMVLARLIGRSESNALAQVFYPNAALCLVMGLVLPFVWRPMPLADLAWVAGYAVLLFAARWVLVVALRLLPAFVVTPLMNLQFVWMAILGALAFGEGLRPGLLIGVAIVAGSGLMLMRDTMRPAERVVRPAFRPWPGAFGPGHWPGPRTDP